MAQLLSQVSEGTLVKLNENGTPVQFYVACQDYESGLNGAGRTLLVRKDLYQKGEWNSTNVNTYANSTVDAWLNGTYKNLLDPWAQVSIGATKFYYTPGNGDNTVTTLERGVFLVSASEMGFSESFANSEGPVLPIANDLIPAKLNGSLQNHWVRTPYKNNLTEACYIVSQYSQLWNFSSANSGMAYRPCFTLPNTLYVLDDGSVSQTPPPPASITTPILVMQGNSVPISWDGVDGVDSYILQRNTDNGGWTQVYAGSDTTFTDTAGSWTTVQYQVCGVFDGTNGAFAQSDVITVVPASTLVISGTDGDLGTITSDITYSVNTDTGNQIALTRTVNGALVASLTVNSGFAYNIPVMDLPTGTGTIVITATVQTSSDPVTVTRTWTYTKQAQTFPASGGLAQLTQDGQNVFPLTLAEAVKAIGGPWGGNLSTALDKLATAATYTATAVPKYTEVTVDLSTVQAGDIVNLPVNGVMVPHIVVQVGNPDPSMYDSSCDGVWLLRKDIVENGQWNSSGVNTLEGSTIMTKMKGYVDDYDPMVQVAIQTVKIPYCVGGGDATVKTLSDGLECKMFPLSWNEVGFVSGDETEKTYTNAIDGAKLDYFLLGKSNSANAKRACQSYYLRTIAADNSFISSVINTNGTLNSFSNISNSFGYRPCFTLPATFQATYYVDPNSGTVYPSQEYTTAGDFSDLWGNIIPTVKIETGSYKGTGTYGADNPNTLTFGFEPKLVFIGTDSTVEDVVQGSFVFVRPAKTGGGYVAVTTQGGYAQGAFSVVLNWAGNSVSWYSTKNSYAQLNYQGLAKYYYVAIG